MSSSAVLTSVRRLRLLLAGQYGQEQSDEQLLNAFIDRHDDLAFAALVHRHGPMVLAVCRRVLGHEQDAEDAFQAVFVVLARKAASLRDKSAVAGFLYGAAFRVASKAKRAAGRRRKYEGTRGALTPPRALVDPTAELCWREVRLILDEEIARLSDRCRSVFILCCLEELSQAETGRRLGLKESTVANRLAEARKRLGQRLARRGVELTAVLTAVTLAAQTASAAPAVLLATTIEAALSAASGTLASMVSLTVVELVQSATAAMSMSKVKIASVMLLAVTLLGGAGVWFAEPCMDQEPHERRSVSPPVNFFAGGLTPRRSPEAAKTVKIQGRVFAPDDQPKAGAKLLLLDEDEKITQLGITAADGRFTAAVPEESKYKYTFRYLIAQAEGTGIDFLKVDSLAAGKPIELRLVKDNVVRGRVVNTEGKPVAGVRVAAQSLNVHINDSLDSFLAAYIKLLAGGKGGAGRKTLYRSANALIAATTDADGRFALHGIGAERTVSLHFSGGGIADTSLLYVVNRAGFDPQPYNREFRDYFTRVNGGRKDQPWMQPHLLSGPDISLIAESEKVIRGIVADADTGKGQMGLEIWLAQSEYGTTLRRPAKTDAEGRYEIHGARKANRYLVQFEGDAASGYTISQVWADDTAGYRPVRADLKVKKGVIVTGKVVDAATGQAIPGAVQAAVLTGNPYVKDYHYDQFFNPSPKPFVAHSSDMDADGTFRIVTLPGPVLLMGGPNHQKLSPLDALKYQPAIPDPKYPKYFQVGPGPFIGETRLNYYGLKGFRGSVDGSFCKVLDSKPGVALIKQDIVLERGRAMTVKIQNAEGRPLAGAWAAGISPTRGYRAIRLESDTCPVYQFEAGKPRLMVYCDPSQNLAGTLTLQGAEKEPVALKLAAMATLKGRLLDADGKPLAGLEVDLHYSDHQAEAIHFAIHEGKQIVTDANGAFAFDELLLNSKFALKFRRGSRPFQHVGQAADTTVQVKSSECRDLGDIKVKQGRERKEE